MSQVALAQGVLARIRPLGRLDRTVGAKDLAAELNVSPDIFRQAAQSVGLACSGEHYWFGLKSLRTAQRAHERQQATELIELKKRELELLLAQQGQRLTDLVRVRQAKKTKLSGVLTIRLTADEPETLEHALNLTGEPNVSAQVKACVKAYPELREIRTSFVSMKHELEELKAAVNSLPDLVLNLTQCLLEQQKAERS